jgi:hypothetical protein
VRFRKLILSLNLLNPLLIFVLSTPGMNVNRICLQLYPKIGYKDCQDLPDKILALRIASLRGFPDAEKYEISWRVYTMTTEVPRTVIRIHTSKTRET